MLVTDGGGLPLGVLLASARTGEVRLAEATLATVRVPRPRGRPRTRPQALVADKGYDSNAFRQRLRRRGIRPCIPRTRRWGAKPTRQAVLTACRSRWMVDRTFAWLGNYRRFSSALGFGWTLGKRVDCPREGVSR